MKSIGTVLDESKGLGGGFDFLRILLAIAVVTWHTAPISTGDTSAETARFLWIFDYAILLVFFALSGFLIAGSAMRLSLTNFIINRSLRILPALAVEIFLSAVLIGGYFTSLPSAAYFTTGQTYHYFTNIVGWINYKLPGVFLGVPSSTVNASLWTVPFEIGCYAIMAALIGLKLLQRRWSLWLLAGAMLAAGLAMFAHGAQVAPRGVIAPLLYFGCYSRGSGLLIAFVIGIAFYLYRDHVPYSWSVFWACLTYCTLIAAAGHRHYPNPPVTALTVLPLVYMMAFLGVTKIPLPEWLHKGDYSYGIYLYGWPIMQVMRASFPGIGGQPWRLWLISVPAIFLFAIFSWHAIEKPVLRLRKNFSFIARQRLTGKGDEVGSSQGQWALTPGPPLGARPVDSDSGS